MTFIGAALRRRRSPHREHALLAAMRVGALVAIILVTAIAVPDHAAVARDSAAAEAESGRTHALETAEPVAAPADAHDSSQPSWTWPLHGARVSAPFVAPPHAYGPGHRGIDLRPTADESVRAPAAGVVAFAGPVAGRGVLTIDHGNGWVSTLEPIDASVGVGASIGAGAPVGTLTRGGHAANGDLHFGVRLHGEYVNPLLLLGGVPRAVLLPCC